MSKYSQEERIERRAPFTVSDIKDITTWRADQARKEQEWMEAKAKKYKHVIDAMGDGSLLTKAYGPSETTLLWKDYHDRQNSRPIRGETAEECAAKFQHLMFPRLNLPTLIQKTLNWFLNLKFEV